MANGLATRTSQLAIPKRHRSSFTKFLRMSSDALNSLATSLERSSPSSSLFRLANQIADSNPELDEDSAYGILQMLAGLYRARIRFRLTQEKVVNDFIRFAKEESGSLFQTKPADWSNIKHVLLKILKSGGALGLTAKASELTSENERVLCPANCRIITDVRPVFADDPAKDPDAVIIQHALKLAYHSEDDSVKEFYVVLDSFDLVHLQALLARAAQKEKTLRRGFKKSGTFVLGLYED